MEATKPASNSSWRTRNTAGSSGVSYRFAKKKEPLKKKHEWAKVKAVVSLGFGADTSGSLPVLLAIPPEERTDEQVRYPNHSCADALPHGLL